MATCANGHDSPTTDYCDVCGTPIQAATSALPAAAAQHCAHCGAARDGRFCEECGHDAALPAPPPPLEPAPPEPAAVSPAAAGGGWLAVVRADRSWFDEVQRRDGPDARSLEFPRSCPERRFVLAGALMAIGRRSRSRGTDPEIDLSAPPRDPGVSTQHALLRARPDGGWELEDLDSTNGTTLNDAPEPIAPRTPVALADGDRIKVGAWTTITVTARGAEPDQSR